MYGKFTDILKCLRNKNFQHSISEVDDFIFAINQERGLLNRTRVERYTDPYAGYGRQPVSDFEWEIYFFWKKQTR